MKKINTLLRNENVLSAVIIGAVFLVAAGLFTLLTVIYE
jgi:hypothetical protein